MSATATPLPPHVRYRCPKCGAGECHNGLGDRFILRWQKLGELEQLVVRCPRCGFESTEACRDERKPPPAPPNTITRNAYVFENVDTVGINFISLGPGIKWDKRGDVLVVTRRFRLWPF